MLPTKNLVIVLAVAAIVVAVIAGAFLMQKPSPAETTPTTSTQPTTPPPSPSPSPSPTPTSTPSPSPTPTPTPPPSPTPTVKGELQYFTSVQELVNSVEYIKYEASSSGGEKLSVSASTTEGGVVEGKDTWKLECTFVSGEEENKATLWLTKDIGEPVKVVTESNGETYEFTGAQAKAVGQAILSVVFSPLIAFYGSSQQLSLVLTEQGVSAAAEGVTATWEPTTVSISGKTYNAFKVSFTVSPTSHIYTEEKVAKGELTVAELLQNKWFIVHIRVDYTDGTWGGFDIVELKLRS
ncbi:MAG: hypothetical protein DRO23_11300 [Thermoprotei archaeon]|nr:MAG: hypothetical protein DRO23_11300 [Thermoprotei archaeon]